MRVSSLTSHTSAQLSRAFCYKSELTLQSDFLGDYRLDLSQKVRPQRPDIFPPKKLVRHRGLAVDGLQQMYNSGIKPDLCMRVAAGESCGGSWRVLKDS